MKKILNLLYTLCAMSSISFGQMIEIHHDGEVLGSPESTVDGTVGGPAVFQSYYVVNVSGGPLDFSWQRVAEFSQSCMDDQVCTDDSCYPSSYDVPIFNSPDPLTLAPGDSTYFKVGASSSDSPCCAIHKYYLKTGLGITQDSVMVKFRIGETECFLNTEETQVVEELSVYPNPTSSLLNLVLSENYNGSTFKLINIVGEEVIEETIVSGKNQINVENLSNGIYFYVLEKDSELLETKKLIIKH